MAVKGNLVAMEGPALLPVTHHLDLSANAHLVFPVLHVNMMLRPVALFTATTGERVYPVTKAQNVCARLYLLDLNANSLPIVHALQVHATMVVHVRPLLRRPTTIVSALPILLVNDVTSWIVACKKKSVKFLNVKS